MTNDEKAKAYEMALEAARKELGVDRKEWEVVQRVLHNIFPELRESEDERVRKWLYDYISNCPVDNFAFYGGVGKDAVLNYLEKQKEPKPTDLPAGFYYIDLDGNKYYSKEFRYGDMKVKVGEQKPVEDDNGEWDDEYMLNTIIGNYNLHAEVMKKHGDMRQYNLEKSMENWLRTVVKPLVINKSKSAWSEEDEKIVKFLEWIVKNHTWMGDVSRESAMRFLKSLRPVKQELSEKDRKILDDVSHILAGLNYKQVAQDYKQAVENLLSLRPQWKPTEEQMAALKETLETYKGFEEYDAMESLYNDLKKLGVKEEPEYYQHFDPDC